MPALPNQPLKTGPLISELVRDKMRVGRPRPEKGLKDLVVGVGGEKARKVGWDNFGGITVGE